MANGFFFVIRASKLAKDIENIEGPLSKYTGQGCSQNATVAPGHSTMTYHPTFSVISQDYITICVSYTSPH